MRISVIVWLLVGIGWLARVQAADPASVLFADPLDGATRGQVNGGEFVTGGGWRATGPKDRILIELPVAARDGSTFEMDIRNLDLPRQVDLGENFILGLREHLTLSGGGANVPNADFFTMFAGTKYPQFKLKNHTHGFSHQEATYAPIKTFDTNHIYKLKVEWANRRLAVSIDGVVFYEQLSPASDPFDRVKFIQIGYPYELERPARFGALCGPIYSNIKVTAPPIDPRAPLDLIAPRQDRDVTLVWQPPIRLAGLSHYLMTRDSIEIGRTDETKFNDTPPAEGRYTYSVAAVYGKDERVYAAEPALVTSVESVIEAPWVAGPVVVDGKLDEPGWKLVRRVAKPLIGRPDNDVTFGAMWDDTHLYLAAKVLDKALIRDSADRTHDDAVEFLIDGNNNGQPGNWGTRLFDDHDRQIVVRWADAGVFVKRGKEPAKDLPSGSPSTGVAHAVAPVPGGYAVEVAVTWASLGISPAVGREVGIDVRNYDDDDGGSVDAIVGWLSENVSPLFTLAYGKLVLTK